MNYFKKILVKQNSEDGLISAYIVTDKGSKIDIVDYAELIKKEDIIMINGIEYELFLIKHSHLDKYTFEYELEEVKPTYKMVHDITNYLDI